MFHNVTKAQYDLLIDFLAKIGENHSFPSKSAENFRPEENEHCSLRLYSSGEYNIVIRNDGMMHVCYDSNSDSNINWEKSFQILNFDEVKRITGVLTKLEKSVLA